jgi:phosphate transport system ATP-binding protein
MSTEQPESQPDPTETTSAESAPVPERAEVARPVARERAEAAASTAVAEAPGHTVSMLDLNVHYGKNHAVKDVSLDFAANKVTALIGPSGCGKSTVLRAINRMHDETPGARVEGQILLDGADIYASDVDVTAVRRVIGMVFQKPNPFPTMSVYENVAAGLRLSGTKSRSKLDDVVEQSLRGAGLWDEVKDRLNAPGISLSGGQQQRLCIARAIANEPEVILMDEPCSALDPIATLRIEELINELKQQYTIIIVTHNMQQAARVADTTAFMLLGDLVEHNPTGKIFSNPDDSRTEEYVTGKFG